MSNILILNQPQVSQGLTTFTFTIPASGIYNIKCQAQVNESLATGFGAGSGADQGLGASGGTAGASSALQTTSNGQTGLGTAFPNVPANSASGVNPTTMAESTPNLPSVSAGNGAKGLGFGGTANDNATGQNGYGNGAGGGDVTNFAGGGNGTSDGGVGQGFGAVPNNYNQPSALVTTPTSVAGLSSALVILVKQNGTTVYTAPALTPTQSAVQFKYSQPFTVSDVVTVTFSSANASDALLNGTQLTVSLGQGM